MKTRDRINRAFSAAAHSYDESAVVQRKIVAHLTTLLPRGTALENVYEFGCGTGLLTKALAAHCWVKHWYLNDLSAAMLEQLPSLSNASVQLLPGDACEVTPFHLTHHFDLVASSSTLQWIAQPLPFLARLSSLLKADGSLLLSTFGVDNLCELRSLTNRGLDYLSSEEVACFLKTYFEEVSITEEKICLSFPSLFALLRHLKETGVTQLLHHSAPSLLTSRSAMEQLEASYKQLYALPNGDLLLTYHPIYIKATRLKR